MASSAPWTSDDLRKNARSWTLEGDARLLEYMQSISQNLENRAQNTNSKMNQLVVNLEETSVSLDNMTNKLSALQHSQFVENRVYEDDETIANESEVPVDVQNEKEKYDPIETLNKVLKNSIAMMDKCYEKVSIDVEDSDDEEGLSKSIVYKPKNFFEHRPLPHIIGSKEWKEKWHIGLCDTDEEFSDEENREEYSDTSENVSLSASLPSNAPTLSESESSVWGLHPHMNVKRPPPYSPSSDEEISSNTLTSKTSSEDINRLNNNKQMIPPPKVLPPPEPRYYVHKPKEKGLFDESSEESEEEIKKQSLKAQVKPIQQTQVKKPVLNGISNIINDEPPELDEVDRREDSESNQLFYESDEENTKKKKVKNLDRGKTDTYSNIRKKPVNLFDDDDFDSFMKELDKKATEKLSQTNTAKSITNLFDDSLEDEPEPENPAPPKVVKPETPPVVPERKVFKTSLFDDEPEEDNIFANITQKPKSSIATAVTRKVRNLFDDDSSDDDFENIFKSKSNNVKQSNKEFENDTIEKAQFTESDSINNTNNIFENIQNNNSSKEGQPAPLILSNEPPEDDIFQESFTPLKSNEKIKETKDDNTSEKSIPTAKIDEQIEIGKRDFDKCKSETTSVNSKAQALFASDDEDDLFATLSRPPVPTPRVSTDGGSKAQIPHRTANVMQPKLGIPKDSSKLFADEVVQLAGANSETVSQIVTAQPSEPKGKTVDLFEGSLPENEAKNKPIIDPGNKAKKQTFSSILFDDEPPDDDIFNISKKQNNLERDVAKTVKVNIEDNSSSDKSKNIDVIVDKIENSENSKSISSQLKLPDYFDDESLSNNLQKDVPEIGKISTEEYDSSNKFKNIDMLFDKSENTANSSPISSKIKLPDLFDDEPSNDDDVFSNLNKRNPATSDQSNINNSIENMKIVAESNRVTPQNDIIISKNLENFNQQEVENKKENSEHENLKIDNSVNFNKENIFEHNANNTLGDQHPDDNISQEENNSNTTIMKENKDFHQENVLKTAFPKGTDIKRQENDIDLENSGNKDNHGSSLYNPINLFQDIPPDDDFPSSSDTKRLHNIFYDDIAETIPTTSTYSRKQPSNYFFSDEPPPDSFDDDTISDTEKELPKVDQQPIPSPSLPIEEIKQVANVPKNSGQSEIDNKSFSVADLIKKAGAESEYKKPKMSVPAPRKLSTNLNINVAALMPGAKRPSLKTEDSIKNQSSTEDESSSSSSLFSNSLRQSSIESMSPSTATVVTPSKSADPNILPNLTKTRPKMQGKRPSTREGRQEKYRKSLILDATDSVPSRSSNSSAQPVVESKSDNPPEENQSNSSVDSCYPSGENIENNSISQKVESPEDDWLINSIQSEKISPPPQNLNDKKPMEVSKVFNDTDDDDDLFAPVGKVVQEQVKSTSLAIKQATTASSEIKTMQDSITIKSKEPPKSEAKATKSLFSDDESGDDDLFGTVQKKTKGPVLKTAGVKSKDKIFSSDDDDEDIFGKTLKNSKDDSKNEKKLFKRLPMPSSKSLFGDDEDDDDIFASTAVQSKVNTTRVMTAPKKSEKPEKRSPVGSITGDNPLADLLND